jgi:hypothetical protein
MVTRIHAPGERMTDGEPDNTPHEQGGESVRPESADEAAAWSALALLAKQAQPPLSLRCRLLALCMTALAVLAAFTCCWY